MKFLILDDCGGGHYYYKIGIAKALIACGHQAQIYTGYGQNVRPLMDVFYEYRPDVFYSNTYSVTEEQIRVAKKYPECKWILFSSANGEVNKDVGLEYELVRTNDKEKRLVEKLRDAVGIQFLFIHHHPNKVNYTLGGWKEQCGLNIVGLPNAGDNITYGNGQVNEALKCDIGYIGGFWPYKSKNIVKYFFPLIHKYNTKIFGHGWPVHQCLGGISEEASKHLFKSATITPSFSEPHSTDFGYDCVERPFKTAINGNSLVISDWVDSFKDDFFGDAMLMAKTPKEMAEMVDYYMRHDDERLANAKNLSRIVLKDHTYYHRVATIFENIGEPELAKHALEVHREWLNNYDKSN